MISLYAAINSELGRPLTIGESPGPQLGMRADLGEWGRTLVRYKTDGGKTVVSVKVMVRGSVDVVSNRITVFGLNTHVQDE